MLKQRQLLEQYTAEGASFPFSTLTEVKTKVSPAMFSMRSVYPFFEQVFYRLTELEQFHQQGFGRVMIRERYSSEDFFSDFRREAAAVKEQLAVTRYMFKLFARLSEKTDGGLVGDIFMTNPLGGQSGGIPQGNAPTGSVPSGGFNFSR